MTRREYDIAKRALQIELLKLQGWVKSTGGEARHPLRGPRRGRQGRHDQALHRAPQPARRQTVALDKPSARESTQWYFQRYVAHLPSAGEIVLYDRSWYNRAGVERVMGFASPDEYDEFLRQAPESSACSCAPGIHLVKFWFSVSRAEQRTRFLIRQIDPVRQWKLSPMDLESLDRWDAYTEAKESMFFQTDTGHAPWTVVKSNDKKRARLEAMRHVLAAVRYAGKNPTVVGTPDPLVVGHAQDLFETGEHPARRFPPL